MKEWNQESAVEKGMEVWGANGKDIDEVFFAKCFLEDHPMKCTEGRLFTINGAVQDEDRVRRAIMKELAPVARRHAPKTVENILGTIKLLCMVGQVYYTLGQIHLANGTVELPWAFTEEKSFCLNRLPVNMNIHATCDKWEAFLRDLLEEEDIPTLQQYLGYCLIPTNKAQKMMILVGKGGEGKSVLGQVLQKLFGNNLYTGSIQKIETDRFARANLQYKLLMIDDDLKLEALPQTNNIKTLVTLEGRTDLEKKGKQSYQGTVYCRFLCFGNGPLSALYDRTYGFYRRQLILKVKERDTNRVDNPFLVEDLEEELEGIFLWCLAGLNELVDNQFKFTVSERTKRNMEAAMREGNNLLDFLESDGYIRFEEKAAAPSREICRAYRAWCMDNSLRPLSDRTVLNYLKENQESLNLRYTTHTPGCPNRSVRGFQGIQVLSTMYI